MKIRKKVLCSVATKVIFRIQKQKKDEVPMYNYKSY